MTPPDIEALQGQYDVAERDAQALVSGLDERLGTWCASENSWSVAQCLDHLATGNRIYLSAMQKAAMRARQGGRWRRGPAMPGLIGRWFVNYMEPPVKRLFKTKAPRSIRPRSSPALRDAFEKFIESHHEMAIFLQRNADLDLAHIHFVNPFIHMIRFSLATGLHVIPAHERRHLWQAWRIRKAAEDNAGVKSVSADSKS
ncbi:MAG TPA: DinB family protein [Candidatus Angelobacter sp.]